MFIYKEEEDLSNYRPISHHRNLFVEVTDSQCSAVALAKYPPHLTRTLQVVIVIALVLHQARTKLI